MQDPAKYRHRLLDLLRKKSYEKKSVVLSSGMRSDFYIDVKQTALDPEGMHCIGNLIFHHLMEKGEPVEAVGGMTMGADPLAVATSLVSYLEKRPLFSFFVRKEPKKHGTMRWIEGSGNLTKGMKVAILEDVVTTGMSTLKSIERAELSGCRVKRVIAVVDRQEGGRENIEKKGYHLEALFVKSDFDL